LPSINASESPSNIRADRKISLLLASSFFAMNPDLLETLLQRYEPERPGACPELAGKPRIKDAAYLPRSPSPLMDLPLKNETSPDPSFVPRRLDFIFAARPLQPKFKAWPNASSPTHFSHPRLASSQLRGPRIYTFRHCNGTPGNGSPQLFCGQAGAPYGKVSK
jgi:hypothetical protein